MNDQSFENENVVIENEYLTPAENKAPTVLAILSMVFGIIGFSCCGAIPFGTASIILSAIYKKKGGTNPMATVGMVLAIVSLSLVALTMILYIVCYIFVLCFGFAMIGLDSMMYY